MGGRRRPAAWVGLTAAALALAGCATQASGGTAPPATTAPPASPPKPRTIHLTIEANGDLLIHRPVWLRAQQLAHGRGYDFAPLLRYVKPYVAGADLAICHVETPMTAAPPAGYPVFNTPPALARAIRATGWDVCDTASNHSLDQGQAGIDATGAALDRAGVRHTGSFASAAARRRTLIVRVKGVRVAFLAYTEMTNGILLPHPWSVNLAHAARILADARLARRRGAQVVIVNLHWGTENVSAPDAFQRALAARLTRSPAITAVIGQHVHVVQPIARVNGKLVVFGEGNLLSNQTPACCAAGSQDGLLALLRVDVTGDRARLRGVEYVPVWVRHPDYAVLPIGDALRRRLADASALRGSYARTVRVAGRARGVTPVPARLP
ncbi:MAG TPA: CapA family protein [Conexibacter sp.]|nr:CapA family protein [Conexibacter sp.]